MSEGKVTQLGSRPNRIDLLNFLTEAVWQERTPGELDGVPLHYIDLESFRINKLAADPFQTLAQVSSEFDHQPQQDHVRHPYHNRVG